MKLPNAALVLALLAAAGCGKPLPPGEGESEANQPEAASKGTVASRFISQKILRDMDSGNPEVVLPAIEAAAASKDASAVPMLKSLLGSWDMSIRFKAASALGRIGDSAGFEALIALARDKDQYMREAAIFGLGESKNPKAIPVLRRAAADHASNVRKAAIYGLGICADAESFEVVASGLRDEDMYVRHAAVLGLAESKDPRAVPLIEKTWKNDRDVQVNLLAAQVLFRITARKDAWDYMLAMLKSENPVARFTSANMLGICRDKAAIEPLVEALKDEEGNVLISAATALQKITGMNFGPVYKSWKDWISAGAGGK